MDYCPGGDLALKLAQTTTFNEDVSKFYVAEVILGLERLHDLNIIYRDLKPENILLGNYLFIFINDHYFCFFLKKNIIIIKVKTDI